MCEIEKILNYNIHVSFGEILLVHFFKRRTNSRALVPWAVVIERLDINIIDQPKQIEFIINDLR